MVITQPDDVQSFLVLKHRRENVQGEEISTRKGTNVRDHQLATHMFLPCFKNPCILIG
jgi:hypothetical protein